MTQHVASQIKSDNRGRIVYVCMYVCLFVCLFVCLYLCMCVWMCVDACVCVCVGMGWVGHESHDGAGTGPVQPTKPQTHDSERQRIEKHTLFLREIGWGQRDGTRNAVSDPLARLSAMMSAALSHRKSSQSLHHSHDLPCFPPKSLNMGRMSFCRVLWSSRLGACCAVHDIVWLI
jgi:hypothetical protein